MNTFLRWWLVFALIIAGSILLVVLGFVDVILKADATRLSFVIYVAFLVTTIWIGRQTYLQDRHTQGVKFETGWFISDVLLSLGMIGTLWGFIHAGAGISTISTNNIAATQMALAAMGLGLSTALYTTLAGLVCSMVLKIQLFWAEPR